MPVFDIPITANDASIERVLAQKLPVLLYIFDRAQSSHQEALERIAKQHAGSLLVVRVNAEENPETHTRLERPALPAVIGITDGQVKSQSSATQTSEIEAHANYLLGRGPRPTERHQETKTQPRTAAGADERQAAGSTAPGAPIHVSDATFASEVLNSDIPVLVDFWAPWCGPCHMVAPTLDRLAQQYAGRIKIAKLNVDENGRTPSQYQISGIPHLIMFKNGTIAGRLVGAHPQQNIEALIRKSLL